MYDPIDGFTQKGKKQFTYRNKDGVFDSGLFDLIYKTLVDRGYEYFKSEEYLEATKHDWTGFICCGDMPGKICLGCKQARDYLDLGLLFSDPEWASLYYFHE